MLALLIGFGFSLALVFALAAIATTSHRYHGQWDALAAERRALMARTATPGETSSAEPRLRRTVTGRVVEAVGPVVYQRRFTARAESTPLRLSRRAAA